MVHVIGFGLLRLSQKFLLVAACSLLARRQIQQEQHLQYFNFAPNNAEYTITDQSRRDEVDNTSQELKIEFI